MGIFSALIYSVTLMPAIVVQNSVTESDSAEARCSTKSRPQPCTLLISSDMKINASIRAKRPITFVAWRTADDLSLRRSGISRSSREVSR